MSSDELDIADAITWAEGLPRLRWDVIEARAASHGGRPDIWTGAARRWLGLLAEALGEGYEAAESEWCLMVAPRTEAAESLLWFAGTCRERLLTALDGVAEFSAPGKQAVVALRDAGDYYRYVAPLYPEGEHGGSAGLHIRVGYPHVAVHGRQAWALENTLAHELTHAALHHLDMPQWLEEGLAQMVEHDLTGRGLLALDAEGAARHKRYWGRHGLDAFWWGEGFSRPGQVQELSYQLAEVLARLQVEDARPRWFARGPRLDFLAFLRAAKAADCGEAACREHLGCGLSDLAARFLGPGAWSPSRQLTSDSAEPGGAPDTGRGIG